MIVRRIELNQQRLAVMTVGVCQTRLERARGLLLRRWGRSRGLLLRPCRGIHTWAMDQPLDLLFCDAQDCIIDVVRNVPPWRFVWRCKARCVWEFRAGAIDALGFCRGDRIRPC